MGYTINDFIKSDRFPGLCLISENSGTEREILGVRIIEVPNMEDYLLEGQLLLTSLKAYSNVNTQEFRKHIENIIEKNASGFIICRLNWSEKQETQFDIIMKLCAEHNISVMEVPKSTSLLCIAKYVLMNIFHIEIAKLMFFRMAHDCFSKVMFDLIDIRETMKQMLRYIAAMLDNPVAVYRTDYSCIESSSSEYSSFEIKNDLKEYKPDVITRQQYFYQKRDYTEYIKKFDILGQEEIYLVITEKNEPLSVLDFIGLENSLTLLQYIFVRGG